jgi:uncharacterized protein YbaR (Trm112 family)
MLLEGWPASLPYTAGMHPLSATALNLLACPVCRGPLFLEPEGSVGCNGCGRHYPIIDGIPVLIPERASAN